MFGWLGLACHVNNTLLLLLLLLLTRGIPELLASVDLLRDRASVGDERLRAALLFAARLLPRLWRLPLRPSVSTTAPDEALLVIDAALPRRLPIEEAEAELSSPDALSLDVDRDRGILEPAERSPMGCLPSLACKPWPD